MTPPDDSGGPNIAIIAIIAVVALAAIGGAGYAIYARVIAPNRNTPDDQDFNTDEGPDDEDDPDEEDFAIDEEEPDDEESPAAGTTEYERLKYDRTFDTVAEDSENSPERRT